MKIEKRLEIYLESEFAKRKVKDFISFLQEKLLTLPGNTIIAFSAVDGYEGPEPECFLIYEGEESDEEAIRRLRDEKALEDYERVQLRRLKAKYEEIEDEN